MATSNKFLDSHPNFVENWVGLEVFIFYFSDCFKNTQTKYIYMFIGSEKNRTVLKEA